MAIGKDLMVITMNIQILITRMAELFILICIGYAVYKLKVINDGFVKQFSRLVLDVTLPAMILSSVLKLEERQPLSDVLTCLGTAIALIFLILPILGIILAKAVRAGRGQTGLYTFMNTFSNIGFMGFPVIAPLCGSVGLFYTAIFNLVFNIAVYSLGIWLMNRDKADSAGFDPKMILTPGTVISTLSLILYFLDPHIPVLVSGTIDILGQMTSPAAMLIIGFSLARIDVKSVFTEWRLYPWTILKQLVVPLLLWYPLTWVIKNPVLLEVTYILTAMPVANSSVLFAATYDGDVDLAAKGVFITTLFSLVTVPLTVMLVM